VTTRTSRYKNDTFRYKSDCGFGMIIHNRIRHDDTVSPLNSFNLTPAMDASVQLQLATASYIYIHHTIVKNKKRKSPRWWMSQLYQSRQIYSGSSLMADLKFEHISGLYKNFTRMHPTDFEFLINAVGPSISRKDTKFRASIPVQERLAVTLRFLATGDSYISLQYLFKISKQSINRIVPEVCDSLINTLKNYIQVNIFIN
jgi:hypothetical protein